MTQLAEYLENLQAYLTENHPGALIMPARDGGKIPMLKHKGGQYDLARFHSEGKQKCAQFGCLIILSHDLVVIDIDDFEYAKKIEEEFPEFKETVTCRTAKAFHYYFLRTPECDLKDGARQLIDDIPIDFKTKNDLNATGGIISIPPSPGKIWAHGKQLGKAKIHPMSAEFLAFCHDKMKKKKMPAAAGITSDMATNVSATLPKASSEQIIK
jgi:hypothetical protein